MALSEDKMRLTIFLEKELGEKVTELAKLMALSESRMAALLIEAGVQDHETLIKWVSSKFATSVYKAFGLKVPETVEERERLEASKKQKGGQAKSKLA